jgi:CRP-like cAMP-binding protein
MIMENRRFIPEILARQGLFRALDVNERARLTKGTSEYRVGKNEMLFHKGDSPAGMHLVLVGQIKLFLPSPTGTDKVVHLAGAGDSFGEEAVLPGKPCPLAAQANRDSILLVLEKQALLDAMAGNCQFANTIMARLCERMYALIDNMETCVQRGSAQRVAHFLTQHAPREADSYDLELDVNKQTIASQLNLAPETFSRVLNRLSRDGLIHIRSRNITLRDLDSLRAFAG